jgi:peptidoglycan/LPS O-acetylase OafA/YrhL
MEPGRSLLVSGVVLLSISALLGFVQERHRDSPEAFAQWRVVHAGGAAGAVQLIALAAVWNQFAAADWKAFVAWGLILASWAFFLGPLARAMRFQSASRWINAAGAIVALPTYILLPAVLVG